MRCSLSDLTRSLAVCILAFAEVSQAVALDGESAAKLQGLIAGQKFTEAATILEPAFKRGDPDALMLWGLFQATGAGVTHDSESAHRLWKQAAHLGQRDAIRLLIPTLTDPFQCSWWNEQLAKAADSAVKLPASLVQVDRDGILPSGRLTLPWNEKRAARADPMALYNLYQLRSARYEWTIQRKEELLVSLKKAALAGFVPALTELGRLYTSDPRGIKNPMRLVEADEKLAGSYLRRAADLGDDNAQLLWAHRLTSGDGVDKNLELALDYYRRSSDRGNAYAPYFLAEAYAKGKGVEKDGVRQWEYLKLAAERDNDTAVSLVAHRLFYGETLPKNEEAAITQLVRMLVTSLTPSDDAIALVAFAYGYGRGAPRDVVAAFKWAEWAAAKGSADAKYQVGLQYLSGQGVEADPIAGYVNLLAAAAHGHLGARLLVAHCKATGLGTARDVPEAIKDLESMRKEGQGGPGEAAMGLAMIKFGESSPEYYDRPAALDLLASAAAEGHSEAQFLHDLVQAEVLTDRALMREKIVAAFAEAKQRESAVAARFLSRAKGDLDVVAGYFIEQAEEMDEAEIQRRMAEASRPVGDSKPQPVYLPKPRYPFLMMLQNREGQAVVEFVIDEEGRVADTRLVSDSHILFGERAREIVHSWRFVPAYKEGRPVKILVSQRIEFKLDEFPAADKK